MRSPPRWSRCFRRENAATTWRSWCCGSSTLLRDADGGAERHCSGQPRDGRVLHTDAAVADGLSDQGRCVRPVDGHLSIAAGELLVHLRVGRQPVGVAAVRAEGIVRLHQDRGEEEPGRGGRAGLAHGDRLPQDDPVRLEHREPPSAEIDPDPVGVLRERHVAGADPALGPVRLHREEGPEPFVPLLPNQKDPGLVEDPPAFETNEGIVGSGTAEDRDAGHRGLGNHAGSGLGHGQDRRGRRRRHRGQVDGGVVSFGISGVPRRPATRGGEHGEEGADGYAGRGHLGHCNCVHRPLARRAGAGPKSRFARIPRAMRAPRTLLLFVLIALFSMPVAALAQETPTPGVTPEEFRGWPFYLFAVPVALLTVGVVALIAVMYFRYSTRFFAREEPPAAPVRRRRPQFAGVAAAPRVEQVAAASTTPPAPPAAAVRTAAEQVPETRPAETEAAAEPAAKRAPAESAPPAEPAPARPAAEHVEPDQETYERELKAQLDKGVDRRVAEGRAKAAAIRAARAGTTAGTVAPEATTPQVEASEAEAATEAGKEEAPEAKEPEVPPPTPPEEGPPAKVPPGADEETFTRVLEEQLAKGLARPIAESRARAAAVKAARERGDAGSS